MRLPVILLLASVLLACDSYPIPVDAPCDAVSESGTDTSSETGSSDASIETGSTDTSSSDASIDTGTEGNAGYCCRCDTDVCEWAEPDGTCVVGGVIGKWVSDCMECPPECGG